MCFQIEGKLYTEPVLPAWYLRYLLVILYRGWTMAINSGHKIVTLKSHKVQNITILKCVPNNNRVCKQSRV